MSVDWQLTPDVDKPEAAETYHWPPTTTLINQMRDGYFKVSHLLPFLEYAVGHEIGNPDTMNAQEVLELSTALTTIYQEVGTLADDAEIEYPVPLEEYRITYAKLRDLEVTFRFAAEHGMSLRAY